MNKIVLLSLALILLGCTESNPTGNALPLQRRLNIAYGPEIDNLVLCAFLDDSTAMSRYDSIGISVMYDSAYGLQIDSIVIPARALFWYGWSRPGDDPSPYRETWAYAFECKSFGAVDTIKAWGICY